MPSDFAVDIPPDLMSADAINGLRNFDVQGAIKAATAPYQDLPQFKAEAARIQAQKDFESRQAAYKAANPDASLFAVQWNAMTPEMQAQTRASYGKAHKNLDGSLRYTGVAPKPGQDMVDYMLANKGAMPAWEPKPGPTPLEAALNVALFGSAFLGIPAIGNLLAGAGAAGAGAGAGAAGAGAAGAGAAGAGAAGAGAAGAGAAGAGAAGALGAGALGAAGTVSELVITAAASGMTIPQIAAAVGIPALAVSNVLQNAAGSNTMRGGEAGDTLSQPGEPPVVDELVIEAAKTQGISPYATGALTRAGVSSLPTSPSSSPPTDGAEVSEVVVEPSKLPQKVPIEVLPALSTAGLVPSIPSNVEGLTTTADALGPDSPAGQLGSKIAAGEIVDKVLKGAEIASKVAPLISAAGGGGSDSKTGSGIPPGFATAGTPGSLSDKFRAQLPAPSGPFGNLAARDVAMTPEQWKTYGARPEQSFFANVPIRPSGIIDTSKRAPVNPGPVEAEPGLRANVTPEVQVAPGYWPEPNSPASGGSLEVEFDDLRRQQARQPGFNPSAPSSVNSTSGSDMNRGGMTAEQFAVAMKRMEDARRAQPMPAPTKGFKTGGFAVRGPGTGRSDEIPARLSDGEYVIDAETVALLGDGSTQAGSKRLDDFRVNIRKHKGRQLSKGKFSHNARKPEAYLHGGRV